MLFWSCCLRRPPDRSPSRAVMRRAARLIPKTSASGRLYAYGMTAESGRSQKYARPLTLVRFQFARKSPTHHLPQCRGTAPYFLVWCGPTAAEPLAGFWSVYRSAWLWSAASSGFRRSMSPALQPRPNDAQSVHIGVWKHEVNI